MNNPHNMISLYGETNSREAYNLRDFLQRSVVAFNWIELKNDQDCQTYLHLPELRNVRLPVVELPNGELLFAPTVREVAEHLGLVSKPRLYEYDLSIYGAGPAGLSAAVYAASEGLRVILIERHAIGGQAGSSSLIENYMGFPHGISGGELAERARQQAVKFGAEILLLREGIKAEFHQSKIFVDLADGGKMVAKANICATGVEYRRLDLANEIDFLGKGLFYGAGASEAPFCKDQIIFVVGGANSAGQAAMHFSAYAKKVVMVVRGPSFADTMSQYLCERIQHQLNIEVRFNSEIVELDGETELRKITIQNKIDNSHVIEDACKLFVCIGGNPNTEWAKETDTIRDEAGYLVTGPDLLKNGKPPACWKLERLPYFLETSVPGSFAAGDVRHGSTKRAAAAVGEGAMAITFVHRYLRELNSKGS
jgi:thioredoxin reductase (NADPH)